MDSFALVTGASSGIGYCYARELASRGYGIIAVSNDEPALMEKAEVIRRDFGVSVDAVVMDLSAADAPEKLYHHCRAQGYQVDFLVNNAGVYHDRDFLDDREWIDPDGFLTIQKVYKIVSPMSDVMENQMYLPEEDNEWALLKRQ